VRLDPRNSRWVDSDYIWIPNVGVDPNTPYYRQNSNNGTHIPAKVVKPYAFNDILLVDNLHPLCKSGYDILLYSCRMDDSVRIGGRELLKLANQLVNGFFIGRLRFAASNELKLKIL